MRTKNALSPSTENEKVPNRPVKSESSKVPPRSAPMAHPMPSNPTSPAQPKDTIRLAPGRPLRAAPAKAPRNDRIMNATNRLLKSIGLHHKGSRFYRTIG